MLSLPASLPLALEALKKDMREGEGDSLIILSRGPSGWYFIVPDAITTDRLQAALDEAIGNPVAHVTKSTAEGADV
jgi:hypothetical protein